MKSKPWVRCAKKDHFGQSVPQNGPPSRRKGTYQILRLFISELQMFLWGEPSDAAKSLPDSHCGGTVCQLPALPRAGKIKSDRGHLQFLWCFTIPIPILLNTLILSLFFAFFVWKSSTPQNPEELGPNRQIPLLFFNISFYLLCTALSSWFRKKNTRWVGDLQHANAINEQLTNTSLDSGN